MTKKKKSIFAECDGELFVELRAIMESVIAMLDGLPIVFLGKGKTSYLGVDIAIEWCRKEAREHPEMGRGTLLTALLGAKERWKEKQSA